MACYNCGSDEHNSKNCDKPPKYTRCGGCDNVASSPDQHKPWCRQKHFVSEYIGQQVYQVKPLFQIKFEVDTNVSIMDASNTIVVQEGLPLWIASVDAHVMRQGRTLQFISARDSKRNFTFVNNHDKAIISLQTDDVSTTFNCRYQIFRNGYVSFEYKRPNSIKTPVVCRIKIHNGDDMFKINFTRFDMTIPFEVYPTGPILVDSQVNVANNSNQHGMDLQIVATTSKNDEENEREEA